PVWACGEGYDRKCRALSERLSGGPMTATYRGTTTCGGRAGEVAGREGEGRRGARGSDRPDEGSDGAAETAEGPPGTGRIPRTAEPSAIPPSSTPTIAN